MSTTNANINVNVNGIAQLDKLQQKVGGLTTSFGKLKGIIGVGFLTAGIKSVIGMADSMQDLADATDFAIENILGFNQAVIENGGNAQQAQSAMLKFTQTIGEAAEGSKKARETLAAVGVSLDDLRTLSNQALFDQAIAGVSSMSDAARRATVSTDLFGKTLNGVNLGGISSKYQQATASSNSYANSVREAAMLQGQLDSALIKVQYSLLKLLEPTLKFINAIDNEKISRFFEILKTLDEWSPRGILAKQLDLITEAYNRLIGAKTAAESATSKPIQADVRRVDNVIDAQNAAAREKETAAIRERQKIIDEAESKRLEQVNILKQQIRNVSIEFERQLGLNRDQYVLQQSLVGKSKEYQEIQTAVRQIQAQTADEVNRLQTAMAALTSDQKADGLTKVYEQQIETVKALGLAEEQRLTNLIKGLNAAQNAEEFLRFEREQSYALTDKLTELQRQTEDLNLSGVEAEYAKITRAINDTAVAAIRAEETRRGAKLSPEEAKRYYDTAAQGANRLYAAQKKLYDQSRQFSTGWNRAFKDYVDNARNAAQTAERLFEKFTSGLEDAFIDFVKTGKFEWKNFVADMIEELLRSQFRNTLASLMELPNPFGSGTINDMFGGLLGGLAGGELGSSASNPMYVVDISGGGGSAVSNLLSGKSTAASSSGGGFFDSLGNLFSSTSGTAKTYGTNIGSQQSKILAEQDSWFEDSGGGLWDTISNFGSSVVSGIGSLFDGWFANGGTIGAGKFGIVGERGPEIVGGPATVTPMGGSTSVTYNIQAVDAASFKAMVARDPSFLYAVTEQGRLSTAGARR